MLRAIKTIAYKDFKTLITSPIFLIIATLCAALWSFNFLRAISMFAQSAGLQQQMGQGGMNIHYSVFVDHISVVNLIFIFALPAITMRLIAEEKRAKTSDLLLTSPITSADIAIGKFLAGFGVAIVLVLISAIYPLFTRAFADFYMGPLFSSYIGLTLMAGVYIAVGLFAPSLTESAVLSVILGIIFNLILWLVGQGTSFSDNSITTAVLEYISIPHQSFIFLRGAVATESLIFFASTIVLFVFLSQRVIESARWR